MTGLVIGVDAEHSDGPSSRRLAQPGRGARLSSALAMPREGGARRRGPTLLLRGHAARGGGLRVPGDVARAGSGFQGRLRSSDRRRRRRRCRCAQDQVEPYLGGGKWPDVVMELPGLLVLVENKVRPRAFRPGQLAEYHVAAVARWPRHRVISVFLTPDRRSGSAEVRRVRRVIRGHARDDAAVVLTWRQVHWLLRFANGSDVEFRRTGIRAIARAIAAYPIRPGIAPPRPTDIRTGQPLDGRP